MMRFTSATRRRFAVIALALAIAAAGAISLLAQPPFAEPPGPPPPPPPPGLRLPASLPEAREMGCSILPLKNPDEPSCACIVPDPDEEETLWVAILDAQPSGLLRPAEMIRVPNFGGEARIDFEDPCKRGVFFIAATYPWLRGDGTKAADFALIGWRGGAFRCALNEPASLQQSSPGYNFDYKMDWRPAEIGEEARGIELTSEFGASSRQFEQGPLADGDYETGGRWVDALAWNEKKFSFYEPEEEKRRMQGAKNFVERNLHAQRIAFARAAAKAPKFGLEEIPRDPEKMISNAIPPEPAPKGAAPNAEK